MDDWITDCVGIENMKLHFTRTGGNKPPFLLLHGYSDNGLCWTRTAKALENDFDVIMLDFRNHGLSTVSETGINSYEIMQEVAEFIKILELDKIWILGHSMGGRIASLLAKEYPSLVKGLILEDPAFNFSKKLNLREFVIYLAFSVMLNSTRKSSVNKIIGLSIKSNPKWDKVDHETWATAQYQFAKLKQKPSLKGLREDRVLYNEVLPYIKVPLLILVAENGVIPKKYFTKLKNSFQEGEWILYKNTGHNIHREEFDSFIDTVKNFVQYLI
jgi:pimeloyl-ACP methyl ester carboxylesterase